MQLFNDLEFDTQKYGNAMLVCWLGFCETESPNSTMQKHSIPWEDQVQRPEENHSHHMVCSKNSFVNLNEV